MDVFVVGWEDAGVPECVGDVVVVRWEDVGCVFLVGVGGEEGEAGSDCLFFVGGEGVDVGVDWGERRMVDDRVEWWNNVGFYDMCVVEI